MEIEHLHLPIDLAHGIGYILMGGTILYILLFSFIQGRPIISGLKGKDGIWQFIEVTIIIWLIIFPGMMIADIYLGFHASEKAWYGMEIIFIAAVGGKVGLSHINKPKAPVPPPNMNESLGNEE